MDRTLRVIVLNPESPIPLYRQLADSLLARIRDGEYRVGARIPSEHQLAERFGVGRPTVRQATDLLIREGLLRRRRGAGTFVCGPPEEVDLFSLMGTRASFEQLGLHLETRILQRTQLRSVPEMAENPFAGGPAYALSRVHRVDHSPVLLEEIYLDPARFRHIDRFDLQAESLSRVVAEHYYLRPYGGQQSFRIGTLVGPRARALEVTPAAPVLIVRRWLHFPDGENGVYADVFCRTDRFAFSQTLGRPEAPNAAPRRLDEDPHAE